MDPPYSLNISLGFHYVWGFCFTAVPCVRVSCLQLASGLSHGEDSGQWCYGGNNSLAEGCVQIINN